MSEVIRALLSLVCYDELAEFHPVNYSQTFCILRKAVRNGMMYIHMYVIVELAHVSVFYLVTAYGIVGSGGAETLLLV